MEVPRNSGDAKRSLLLKIQRNLDGQAAAVIEEIVDAVCEEARSERSDPSGLVTETFATSILRRLQVHHATAGEKFKKTPFEYAFERANRAEGREVSDTTASNAVSPGWDVKVNGVPFSLKTEAEKALSSGAARRTGKSVAAIKVSKLMEMRRIREFETPEQVLQTGMAAVVRHLGEYERMLTLRGYNVAVPFEGVRYDLYEFPLKELRKHVGEVAAGQIVRTKSRAKAKAEGPPAGSWKAQVVDAQGRPLCELLFDASVEKVTLRGLAVRRCRLLAYWVVKSKREDGSSKER